MAELKGVGVGANDGWKTELRDNARTERGGFLQRLTAAGSRNEAALMGSHGYSSSSRFCLPILAPGIIASIGVFRKTTYQAKRPRPKTRLGRKEERMGGGVRLGSRGDGDVFHLRPALGKARVPGRKHVTGLTRRVHEERTLEIAQIVARAQAPRMAVSEGARFVADEENADIYRIRVAR